MKTILLCGAALAILGVAASPVSAQTQSTTTTSTTYIQASKLIGTKVKASQGEEVGEIKDVVLDNNGCMAYTVLSTGGTGTRVSGGGVKTVAVPWAVYSTTSDPRVLTVRVERDRIYNAPAFEYSRINEYSTGGYLNSVYSYYGVSGGGGVGVSTSTGVSGTAGTSTTTGTTATGAASTTATGSPGATASPMATAGAAATASPGGTASPMASASPAATGSPAATASPTRRATRGESPSGRTRATATPSSRRQTESATEERTGESREETTGSPSTKKSRRHATEEGTTTEPSASPRATPEQE